jgi:hypothetical protein
VANGSAQDKNLNRYFRLIVSDLQTAAKKMGRYLFQSLFMNLVRRRS